MPLVPLAIPPGVYRNALLAASDWTQVADAPVDQAAWAAYLRRQYPKAVIAHVPNQTDLKGANVASACAAQWAGATEAWG